MSNLGRPPVDLQSSADKLNAAIMPAPRGMLTEHRKIWKETIKSARHLNNPSYRAQLEAYCSAISDLRQCVLTIEAEGRLVPNAKGEQVEHPAYKVLHKARADIASLSTKLGLAQNQRKNIASDERGTMKDSHKRPRQKSGPPPLRLA